MIMCQENIQTIVAIWRENILGYLSADIICSGKRTVFQEQLVLRLNTLEAPNPPF